MIWLDDTNSVSCREILHFVGKFMSYLLWNRQNVNSEEIGHKNLYNLLTICYLCPRVKGGSNFIIEILSARRVREFIYNTLL